MWVLIRTHCIMMENQSEGAVTGEGSFAGLVHEHLGVFTC